MSGSRPARPHPPATGERALGVLEALLAAQGRALVAGDLAALEQSHARIHALLSDAAWRGDVAKARSTRRLRAALKAAAVNAGLAARGEAHAARAMSALGATPGLYTSSGGLSGAGRPTVGGPQRGLQA